MQSFEVRGVMSDEGGGRRPGPLGPPPPCFLCTKKVVHKPGPGPESAIFFRQKPKLALSALKEFDSKMVKSRRPEDRAKSPGHSR